MGKSSSKLILPINPDVKIVAHIWPSDVPNCKDLRFHIYTGADVCGEEVIEPDILYKLLRSYTNTASKRRDNMQVQGIVTNPLIPLLQSKCKDLGMNIRWIVIKL